MTSDSKTMDNVVNCLPRSAEVSIYTSKKKFCDLNKYCHVEILRYLDLKSLFLCATVDREWKTRVAECFATWQKSYGFTVSGFIGQKLPTFAGANITRLPVNKTGIGGPHVGLRGTLASLVHRLVLKDYPGQMCVEGDEYGLAEHGASLKPISELLSGVKHLDVELGQPEDSLDTNKLCTILTKLPNVLASLEHFTIYFDGQEFNSDMENVVDIVVQMPKLQVLTCGVGFLAHLEQHMTHAPHVRLLPGLTTLDLDMAYTWGAMPSGRVFVGLSHLTSLTICACDCYCEYYGGLVYLPNLKQLKVKLGCGNTDSDTIELASVNSFELWFLDGFENGSCISQFLCVAPKAKKLLLDFCCDDEHMQWNSCARAEGPRYKPVNSQMYAQEISTCSDRFGKCLEYVEDFSFKSRLEKGMELFLVVLDVLESSAPNLLKLTVRVSELNVEHVQRLSSFLKARADSQVIHVRLELLALPGELSILKAIAKLVTSAVDFGNIERIVIHLDSQPNSEQIQFLASQFLDPGAGCVCRVLDPTGVVHPALYIKVSVPRLENPASESEAFDPPAAKKNKLDQNLPLYFYLT